MLDSFFATRLVTLSIEELGTMSINNLTGITLCKMPSLAHSSSSLEGLRFSNFLFKSLLRSFAASKCHTEILTGFLQICLPF